MRKFILSIVIAVTVALLGSQQSANAEPGVDRGDYGGKHNNAVDAHGNDDGGHNNKNSGGPRVSGFKGAVHATPRNQTTPENTNPVYVSPCNGTNQGTTLNTQPRILTAAFVQPIADDVIIQPNYNAANPPTVYFAVCNYAQPNPQTPNAKDQADVLDWVKAYFSQTPMPVPQPEISAPSGICGVTHTVNLHIDTEMIHTENQTPFGNLQFHVYGRVSMNWGDGNTNVYTTGGAPYPNSDIRHIWTTKGNYNIASHVDWIASFTIGPYNGVDYSGVLSGIATDGPPIDFRVWDAQAMITN